MLFQLLRQEMPPKLRSGRRGSGSRVLAPGTAARTGTELGFAFFLFCFWRFRINKNLAAQPGVVGLRSEVLAVLREGEGCSAGPTRLMGGCFPWERFDFSEAAPWHRSSIRGSSSPQKTASFEAIDGVREKKTKKGLKRSVLLLRCFRSLRGGFALPF